MSVLLPWLFVYHVHAWCPQMPEGALDHLELELERCESGGLWVLGSWSLQRSTEAFSEVPPILTFHFDRLCTANADLWYVSMTPSSQVEASRLNPRTTSAIAFLIQNGFNPTFFTHPAFSPMLLHIIIVFQDSYKEVHICIQSKESRRG